MHRQSSTDHTICFVYYNKYTIRNKTLSSIHIQKNGILILLNVFSVNTNNFFFFATSVMSTVMSSLTSHAGQGSESGSCIGHVSRADVADGDEVVLIRVTSGACTIVGFNPFVEGIRRQIDILVTKLSYEFRPISCKSVVCFSFNE